VCPLQNPRETHLRSCRTNHRPTSPEETGIFRHGWSTLDQVTLLTQYIEDSISAKKNAGGVFVDLTATYDTVWHRGLTSKLLRLLPDRDMVRVIMDSLVIAASPILPLTTNGTGYDASRTASHRNPSWELAPLLFNIYFSDLPTTVSRKCTYAEDLATMHPYGDWQAVEGVLSKDMATVSEYFQTWKFEAQHNKNGVGSFSPQQGS